MSNPLAWLDRDAGPVNYGEPTYWERRLKATIESYFGQPKGQRILLIGCGNSEVPADMHATGYRCITAIDISATVIALMQQQNQDKEGLEYLVADARKLDSFPDGLFDCILDKGCADSLYCGYRSDEDVVDMCQACCRVLRPGGVFLCVSHGEPDVRMHSLRHEMLQWYVNAIPIHESEGLFVYVCTKQSEDEIHEAEKRQEDAMDRVIAMRSQGKHAASRRFRGAVVENLISFAKAPHQLDAASKMLQQEQKEKAEATQAAAAAAAQTMVAETQSTLELVQEPPQNSSGVESNMVTTKTDSDTLTTGTFETYESV